LIPSFFLIATLCLATVFGLMKRLLAVTSVDFSLAAEIGDNGTKTLLEEIEKDRETHFDWLEEQKNQIEPMGIQCYQAEQVG